MTAQVLPDSLKVKSHIQSIFGFVTVSNMVALIMFVVLSVTIVLIVDGLTSKVTVIEPIAVPKALADAGYTPEVAGHRLRDALEQLADAVRDESTVDEKNAANSILAHDIAARDELPDFVVPQIGLSLSAIISSIRSVARYRKGGKVISGELIVRDKDKYALRVRVDGQEVFKSEFASDNPDDLLDRAAPDVLKKVWPGLGATVLYRTRPDQALRDADDIIASFEESDPNVLEAYRLKGGDFFKQQNYGEAEKMFRKAISLNSHSPNLDKLHNLLGVALQQQGYFQDALKEYQLVVSINPKSADGYINIGTTQVQIAEENIAKSIAENIAKKDSYEAMLDEARENYKRAIALKPNDVRAHNNLGLLWKLQYNPTGAMSEFHQVIEINPNYLYGHWNLAAELAGQSKFDEALAEYRAALDCTRFDRDLALIHIHMGNALKSKAGPGGNLDEAIAEYRRAVEIDPSHAWTHNNLAAVLREQGKLDEAIAEYSAALELPHVDRDASNEAQKGIDEANQAKQKAPQAKEKLKEKAKQAGAYKEQALPAAVQDAQAAMR